MKNTALLLAATLAIAACGGNANDPAQKFRDALPKSQAVQIGAPAAATQSGALTVDTRSAGDPPSYGSEYAVTSYWMARTVNAGVRWVLDFLQLVTAYPPTQCDDHACTWGPAVDDQGLNRWKLVVEKVGDHYDYAFSAQPGSNASAPFVDVLAGTAYPGNDQDHGHGTFTIYFDAQDALDHGPLWEKHDYGTLTAVYDNRTSVSIGVTFSGAKSNDPNRPHFVNAAYSFLSNGSGGELQLAFQDLSTTEVISLKTRWKATGAGRGDAHYTGPDGVGGTVEYFASECWEGEASNWVKVFDTDPPSGSEAACAFSPASYATIALP